VQVIDWESVRRRRTAGYLLAAVLTLTVGGCSDSAADADAPAGPSASATAVTSADAQEISGRMTNALVAAGGGTMTAALKQGSLTGALSFGPLNGTRISEIWNTGSFVSTDRRASTYLMHTGPGPEDVEFYVNDGTAFEGRSWAKVPQSASQMKDFAGVSRAHPHYRIVADTVPGLQPHVLPSLIAAQKVLVRSPASETVDGVKVDHYLGSFDGTAPAAGGPMTFELWIDKEGRPTKYLSYFGETQVPVTYGNWGKPKPVTTPPPTDTSVIPTSS
jgi:hypothetical protein